MVHLNTRYKGNSLKIILEKERNLHKNTMFQLLDDPTVKHIRSFAPPGLGKSYIMLEYIRQHPELKFLIIVLNHKQVVENGIKNFLDTYIGIENWQHLKGKKQESDIWVYDDFQMEMVMHRRKLCRKPDGQEYYPGCPTCEYVSTNLCAYKNQWNNLNDKQVIVTTIESIIPHKLPKGRIIFVDESFDTKVLKVELVKEEDLNLITLSGRTIKKCGSDMFTFYNEVSLVEDFTIDSEKTKFLHDFFSKNTDGSLPDVQAHSLSNNNNIVLIKRLNVDFYELKYSKMVFNCATTPIEVMKYITNTQFSEAWENEAWNYYYSKIFSTDRIDNKILSFKYKWTKNMANNGIQNVFKMLKKFLYNKNVFIGTKKSYIKEIKKYLPNADYAHYGMRGDNTFNKEYDLIIIYGLFGLTPVDYECLRRIGIPSKIARLMDIGVMKQLDHRGRLILHPNVPVMMFRASNTIYGAKPISLGRLFDYEKFHKLEIEDGSSLRKICKLFGYPTGKTIYAKEYLKVKEFMKYVLYRKV